jgi:deferrochelatase/peroxidase EfeB
LAVRQLEQDVAGFDAYLDATAARLHGDPRLPPGSLAELREWIAAKLVGRWRNGNPLVSEPHDPGAVRSRADNDFTYGEEDPAGLRCPLGAHIRRVNPRDSLDPRSKDQLAISNRHRILRVGRVYGRPGAERGLLFMCLNADIERQFEFVQQTWAQAPGFHGLDGEVDCFGPRGSTDRMTVPTPHGPLCIERLQDFVTLRGGGYFFLPGRRALHFLAQSLGSGASGIGERGLVASGAGAPAQA